MHVGTLVAALLAVAATVQAFQIVDQEQTVYKINGILQNQPQATVTCNPSDRGVLFNLQVQSSTGALIPVSVTCPIAQRGYTVYNAGFVPRDAGILRVTVYASGNLDNLALVNSSTPGSPYLDPSQLPPGAQALYELSITTPNGWGSFPDSLAVAAMCIAAQSQGENIELYSMCGDGPSAQDITDLMTLSTTANNSFADFLKNISAAQGLGATTLQNILSSQGAVVDWARLMNQTFADIDRNLLTIQNKTVAVAGVLQQAAKLLDAPIQQTGLDAAALNQQLIAVTNSSSSDVQKLALLLSGIDSTIVQNLAQFQQTIKDTHDVELSSTRATEKSLIQLFTALQRWHEQTDMMNSINSQIQTQLQTLRSTPNARGNLLVPFSDDLGTPAASSLFNIGPLYNHIDISDVAVRAVHVFGGTTYGVATRFTDSCGSLALLRNGIVGPGIRDVFDWIGPSGCDATWNQNNAQDNNNYCRCVITLTEQRCPIQNNAGVPDPGAIAAFLQSPISVNFASGCISDGSASAFLPANGGLHGAALTSIADLAAAFAQIGARTPYPTIQARPYQIFSLLRGGLNAYVNYVPDMANPNYFMDMLIPVNGSYARNLVFMYFTQVTQDYILVYEHFDVWNAAVNGRMPDGMYQKRILYKNFGTAQAGSGWEVALAAFTSEMLTVSKLVQTAVYHTAQVTVNGVTTAVSDVAVTDPFESALPGVYVMVWIPLQFSTTRWDISQDALPLIPHGGRRAGTTLLPLSPSETSNSLTDWQVREGRPFPHREIDPAALYQVTIDDNVNSPTFGQCIGIATVGGGSLCPMLQSQYWQAFGIFNDPTVRGSILINQLTASTSFTINVPRGPIGVATQSACPSVLTLGQSGVQLVLLMTNPAAVTATNVVRVTQHGPCAVPAPRDIAIPVGGSARVPFFTCASQGGGGGGGGGGEYVEIAANVDGMYIPCSNTVNLTLADGTGVDRTLAATWNSTLQINVVQTSVVLALAQQVINDAMNQTHALEAATRADLAQYSWTLPNITLAQLQENEDTLLELARNATARAAAIAATSTDYTYITAQFQAQIDAEQAAFTASQAARDAALAQAAANNSLALTSLAQFEGLIDQISVAERIFTRDLLNMGNAMINIIRRAQTLDPTVSSQWVVPIPGYNNSGGNFWDALGSIVVAFLGLVVKGVDALQTLSDSVETFLTATADSLLDYLTKFLLPTLLPILIVGGIVLAVWYGPQAVGKINALCTVRDGNAFSPEMLSLLAEARRQNASIASNAEILARIPPDPPAARR